MGMFCVCYRSLVHVDLKVSTYIADHYVYVHLWVRFQVMFLKTRTQREKIPEISNLYTMLVHNIFEESMPVTKYEDGRNLGIKLRSRY